MVATVYLDALFLLGGTVDYCLLLICGKFADVSIRKMRVLASAVFGGFYSVMTVVFCDTILSAVFVKLAVSLLVVLFSFGVGTFGRFFRLWGIYLVSNFALIGCVLAIAFVREEEPFAASLSSLAIAVLLFYSVVSLVLKRVARVRDRDATVRIEFCGKTCLLHALVDTGNFARDPIGQASVIVAELSALKGLFDKETYRELEWTAPENYPYLIKTLAFAERVRLIPYHTIGTEVSLMLAFRPDLVFVNDKLVKNVLIALCPNSISKCGEFDALVGVGEAGI